MQNNNVKMTTVLGVIISLLAIIVIIMGINLFNKYKEDDKIKKDIQTLQSKNEDVKKHNKDVDNKEKEQEKVLQIDTAMNNTTEFNDKFFVWDSWKTYSDNMKYLRNTFPNLEDNKNVVIDGKDVGTGTAPESTYESDAFVTENKNEVSELIKQSKSYDSKATEKLWFKVSNNKDGKYDITQFESYEKII